MAPVQPEASAVRVGKDIRYIGDFVYGYSGGYPADGASNTVLEFTTGAGVIVGEIRINGALNPLSGSVANANGQIKFNGQTIGAGPMHTTMDNRYYYSEKVVIPPLTIVQVIINFFETDSNDIATAIFTGRVYGAE